MVQPFPSPLSPLIRKLETTIQLTDQERQAVIDLPYTLRELGPDQDLGRVGDRPSQCCLLVEGFAYRHKVTASGKRQIFSVHVQGEMPDLQGLHLHTLDHTLSTMNRARVAFLPHQAMRDLCAYHPRLSHALWRETLIDGAIFREWMLGIGRRNAFGRVAHFMCELVERMVAIGRSDRRTCEFPMTQGEVADMLGLSNVQINRTLQELRRAELIRLSGATLTIRDWPRLVQAGEFDAAYLHQEAGSSQPSSA
jgi:CRP-like cAMP-binding protein